MGFFLKLALWKKYINANGIPIGFPKEPRYYYKEWDEKGSWCGFFGQPDRRTVRKLKIIKKIKKANERKSVLSKKARLKIINDTNIELNEDDLLLPGIYLYVFPNGKKYIGQTKHTIVHRSVQHIRDAFNQKQNGCIILDNKTRDLIKYIRDD